MKTIATAVVILSAAACANPTVPPAPARAHRDLATEAVVEARKRMAAFVESLPICGDGLEGTKKPLRGHLVRGRAGCTILESVDCQPWTTCCHHCGGPWFFEPSGPLHQRFTLVNKSYTLLGWEADDCALPKLTGAPDYIPIAVTGELVKPIPDDPVFTQRFRDTIVYRSICRPRLATPDATGL